MKLNSKIKNPFIVALLTGRGGSKLKNKNIVKINGKPCLQYPCEEAKKVDKIKKFFVSSDDRKILNLSNHLGYKKILRPKCLSKDDSKHIDVINHSLKVMLNKYKIMPDIIVVLLANAPIIKSKWIKDCINILNKDSTLSAVVPIVQDNDHHPLRAKKISDGILKGFVNQKSNISSNRQDLEKNYFLCHNFWVIKTEAIKKNNGYSPWNFMGKKVKGYMVDKSIDIHKFEDIIMAKHILKN